MEEGTRRECGCSVGAGRGRGGLLEGHRGRGLGRRGRVRLARRRQRGRARGGRKPGVERPSGAPLGAETRAGRGGRVRGVGRVGVGAFLVRRRDAAFAAPSAARSPGQGAPGAPLKFGSQRTEFPGRKSVLARSGSCWGRLTFLPLAVDPTRRRRRLENFFLEACSLPNVEGRGGAGGERGSRGAEE